MGAGGYTHSPAAYVNTSQKYDGSAWATYPTIATARGQAGSFGTVSAAGGAICGGTAPSPARNVTEEFSISDTETITAKTLTTS
jgi:hypothetical protein